MNEKIKILGLDVSKTSVTACLLWEIPDDLKRYHQTHKLPIFKADIEGIHNLLNLEFDAVALEPTGIHYAKIWVHWLEQAGKPIRWVGHREVRHYRESHKLPNKSDNADALAIAAYALENWHKGRAFVDGEGSELRYLYLQLQSLINLRVPTLQRLRLQLAHECPELAERAINRPWRKESPGMIRALAGEVTSIKWEKELKHSIGRGLSPFTQGLAQQIVLIDHQLSTSEAMIEAELSLQKYQRYVEVLAQWGINTDSAAALISQAYPIERFLDPNGKPIIDRVDGSKRYRSLAAYKLSMGIGRVQYQSGGELKWKAGGSSMTRKALYLWVKSQVIMQPDLSNPRIAKLNHYYKNGSQQMIGNEVKHFQPGMGDQRVMRVVRRLVEAVFYELITN